MPIHGWRGSFTEDHLRMDLGVTCVFFISRWVQYGECWMTPMTPGSSVSLLRIYTWPTNSADFGVWSLSSKQRMMDIFRNTLQGLTWWTSARTRSMKSSAGKSVVAALKWGGMSIFSSEQGRFLSHFSLCSSGKTFISPQKSLQVRSCLFTELQRAVNSGVLTLHGETLGKTFRTVVFFCPAWRDWLCLKIWDQFNPFTWKHTQLRWMNDTSLRSWNWSGDEFALIVSISHIVADGLLISAWVKWSKTAII